MPNLSEATRPIMWNISAAWLMYLLFVIAMAVFAYGLYQRVMVWKGGAPSTERLGDFGKRFWFMVRELVFQRRVMNMGYPAIFHSTIFYAFVVFVITTAIVAMDFDFGTNFFNGWLYVILTVGCEIGGLVAFVGLGMALYRRLVMKPKEIPSAGMDLLAIGLIFLLILTGFLTEGQRMASIGDKWAGLSFVGAAFSQIFGGVGSGGGEGAHKALWWTHTALAMFWIATIPYTKFAHLLFLPTNAFFARMNSRGTWQRENVMEMMEAEDFDEENFQLGKQKTTEFTWKQLLDLDACIKCGRCEIMCPSTQAGEPFGPRQFINQCQDLHQAILKARAAAVVKADEQEEKAAEVDIKDIVGEAFSEEFLWYCRTCGACMEICPAFIDHVDDMVEVKRNEVMMQGRSPSEGQRFLRTMENMGNPFAANADRVDWMKDELGAPIVSSGDEVDVLYFVGCLTTFDAQKQKIAKDLVKVLKHAGVNCGVMGGGEKCCGDPARVMGQEYQFQQSAVEQIEELNSRKFKTLLTGCPHCFNVLANEYPQFGGNYKVMHHSQFLLQLVNEGKLAPSVAKAAKTVFHDPCYLGRYQNEYDAPRQLLDKLPGTTRSEMEQHHGKALCCGGGGGHFFMDLKGGDKRVNNMRVEQAKAAGADCIAVGCPFCAGMLDDAVKTLNLEDDMKVRDIATLLAEAIDFPEVVAPVADTPEN
jgi:Fe-S oxidoreductase/nitrate reductase gamma subunit